MLLEYNRKLQRLVAQHGERLVEALRKITNENEGYVYDLGHIAFFNPLPSEPNLYLEFRYYPSGEFRIVGVNRKHMYGLMRVFRPMTQDEELDEQKLRQLVSTTIHRISEGLQKLGIEDETKSE